MDDPRCGARPAPRFRWLHVFSILARLWRRPPAQLQPVRVRPVRLPQQEAEDWGELWSTVHW